MLASELYFNNSMYSLLIYCIGVGTGEGDTPLLFAVHTVLNIWQYVRNIQLSSVIFGTTLPSATPNNPKYLGKIQPNAFKICGTTLITTARQTNTFHGKARGVSSYYM